MSVDIDVVTITLDRELIDPLRNMLLDAQQAQDNILDEITINMNNCLPELENPNNPKVVIDAWKSVYADLLTKLDDHQQKYNNLTFILESIEYSLQ